MSNSTFFGMIIASTITWIGILVLVTKFLESYGWDEQSITILAIIIIGIGIACFIFVNDRIPYKKHMENTK